VKAANLSKNSIVSNILQKMNCKMGGVNHALARRDGNKEVRGWCDSLRELSLLLRLRFCF
jgi:hypothetical protein